MHLKCIKYSVFIFLCVGSTVIPEELEPKNISITVVYDNYLFQPRLSSSWGFACVVKTPGQDILFDTGGDSTVLLSNMEKMDIDPENIDMVVISHIHGDHLGGLYGFLRKNPKVTVFIPVSFPNRIRETITSLGAEYQDIKGAAKIAEHVYTTGVLGSAIKEQSLLLDTKNGIVVITGCAHPGIVKIAGRARQILPNRDLHVLMGGFHLGSSSEHNLKSIIEQFRHLKVQKVAPSHCSGDRCRYLFKKEYKENYIESGAGRVIEFSSLP